MILVTAAGGKTGRAVVDALAGRGLDARALSASGGHVEGAADAVAGDAADLGPHLDGVDAVYFIWPNFEAGELAAVEAAIVACRTDGVRRFVYHSVLHPQLEAMPHHWQKLRAEERLLESGLDVIVLQPGAYFQNIDLQLETVAAHGVYRSPWGLDAAQSLVDLRDVAQVAARSCADHDLVGGVYELAGPDRVTARDIAATLGVSLDRPVHAVDQGSDGWAELARRAGASDYAVACGVAMADHYREHGFCGSPAVLEALLGRPPTTLAEHCHRLTSTKLGRKSRP